MGLTKYTVKMGPGAIIYISCFMKIGSGITNLLGGGGGYTVIQIAR
jgi:hypothetical protein